MNEAANKSISSPTVNASAIPNLDTRDVTPKQPGEISLIKQDRPVDLFRSYDQGIMDGLMGNNSGYFENFIAAYHYREYKNKAIYHLREQIRELLENKVKAKEKQDALKAEKYAKQVEHDGLRERLSLIDKILAYWRGEIEAAKHQVEEIKKYKTDYSLFPGLLFFFFACLFIAADYTICLTIVADTLQIGLDADGNYTLPSHLFALAMSGLAVVLKPAYDRLVEKPYHHNEKKKAFTIVIVVLGLAVIVMLWTLGIFREDIIDAGIMDTAETSTDIGIGADAGPVTSGATTFAHPWAKSWGIILSTVLFAIAGAVCLGISLPILFKNFRLHWNLMIARIRNKKVLKLERDKTDLEVSRVAADWRIKELAEKEKELESIIQVDEDVKDKRQMIAVYQHGELVKNIEKSTAIYLAGHERGQKLIGKIPQEWLSDGLMKTGGDIDGGNSIINLEAKSGKDASVVGKRTRPFVALRRMVAADFKKNWQKENEVNIDYYTND